ncbi:hypothetical protein KTR10_00460 [Candidatus Kaiserbacteria bacterium]|nr:hypothetical protein [Candidatus Kaiserbacteria bacterium]
MENQSAVLYQDKPWLKILAFIVIWMILAGEVWAYLELLRTVNDHKRSAFGAHVPIPDGVGIMYMTMLFSVGPVGPFLIQLVGSMFGQIIIAAVLLLGAGGNWLLYSILENFGYFT